MKKAGRSILLLLPLLAVTAYAQDDTSVSGRAIEAVTGRALAFVTITVTRDGEAVAGSLTDESGRFVIAGLPRGDYVVTSTLVGYAPVDTPVLIGERNDNYFLGDLELRPIETPADEIVVSAQQRMLEATLDRRVFDLEQGFAQATGSVLDAMRGLPGVTVDQEGQVRLRGSDRVVVLIDGKQSSLTGFGNQSGLDSIPAGNIATIEIINNPSSAYDAAGMAGIINIVYKKNLDEGLQIDAGLMGSVGQISKRKEDLPTEIGSFSTNPKLNPSVNVVNNADGRGFSLNADVLLQEDLPNNEFTTRFYDDGSITLSQVPENREQQQVVIRGGFDRALDGARTLSFSSIFDFESHKDVAQVPYIDAATMQMYRLWFWTEKEKTGFFDVTLTYTREFDDPGHELEMSLQYTRGWEDEAYFLNDRSAIRNAQDATHLDARENTLPFAIDYVRPTRRGRYETGLRLQQRWIPVDYVVERGQESVIYPGLGDWSEWGETIYAGYFNYVLEARKYAVEAGLRLEQTDVYYDLPPENIYYSQSDSYDYFEPFPNVRVTYNLNDTNRIAFYYNNRIDRPGEPELRIFPKYDDPELLKVGNPYLRPQFTESREVSYEHLWDRGSIVASLYTRDIDDPFTRVFAIDPSSTDYDIVNRIYQNVGSGTNEGVELLFAQRVGSRWQLSGSFNWYENIIEAAETTLLFPVVRPFSVPRTVDKTWDAKINSLLRLASGIEAQLSVVYYDAKNIAQGREAARSTIDLGMKKPILDDQGELVVTISDLLNRFGQRQEIRGEGFDAIYENYFESQVVSVGMTYRF